jgi:hypothetical protein
MGWTVVSRIGNILQCLTGSSTPRLGAVESLILEYGNIRLEVELVVADLGGDEELIIGVDLFRPLGFTIQNVPFIYTWSEVPEEPLGLDVPLKRELDDGPEPTEIQKRITYPAGVDEAGIHPSWLPVLADNASIPVSSRCKLPGACVSIDTGTQNQYGSDSTRYLKGARQQLQSV